MCSISIAPLADSIVDRLEAGAEQQGMQSGSREVVEVLQLSPVRIGAACVHGPAVASLCCNNDQL